MKTPNEVWESMPTAEDIWPNDKYQHAPVEKYIPDADEDKPLWRVIEDELCEWLLLQCIIDPGIVDEYQQYAKRFNVSHSVAIQEIRRRLRNDS